jgi:hypothetical protein
MKLFNLLAFLMILSFSQNWYYIIKYLNESTTPSVLYLRKWICNVKKILNDFDFELKKVPIDKGNSIIILSYF